MRPRNWWSCASPNRSACSITITLASGTSTPTSITVVATSKLRFAGGKARHGGILVGAFHAAMDEIGGGAEARLKHLVAILGGGKIDGFGFLDQRTHPIDPAAFGDGAADRIDHFVEPVERDGARVDRQPSGGLFAQVGEIHVAKIGEHQVRGIGVAVITSMSTASPLRASARR